MGTCDLCFAISNFSVSDWPAVPMTIALLSSTPLFHPSHEGSRGLGWARNPLEETVLGPRRVSGVDLSRLARFASGEGVHHLRNLARNAVRREAADTPRSDSHERQRQRSVTAKDFKL